MEGGGRRKGGREEAELRGGEIKAGEVRSEENRNRRGATGKNNPSALTLIFPNAESIKLKLKLLSMI